MASESSDGDASSVAVPDDVDVWLDERAETLGLDREDLLRELLSAHRAVASADDEYPDAVTDPAIDGRFDALEEEFGTHLDEVRRRLVQVKREVDDKAPADHDHEAFDAVDSLEGHVDTLADRLDSQAARIESIRDQVDALESGIEDLDAAVDDLRETTGATGEDLADVREKLARLAQVVVSLRDGGGSTIGSPDDRLVAIKRLAAREGYGHAECASCGGTVYLTVLPEPTCPHCDVPVHDVVERGALRNRPTLVGDEADDE